MIQFTQYSFTLIHLKQSSRCREENSLRRKAVTEVLLIWTFW